MLSGLAKMAAAMTSEARSWDDLPRGRGRHRGAGTGVEDLLRLFDLERIERNLFRGYSPDDGWRRIYGGQVLGQALAAASRTVDERTCHSFHAYFLRAGDPQVPILYEVDRARDGGSFTARRVIAIQHGRQILNMAASFQITEEGLDHQDRMPEVPAPDALESFAELAERSKDPLRKKYWDYIMRYRPVELRPVLEVEAAPPEHSAAVQYLWFRPAGPVPGGTVVQQSMLAYLSDLSLLDTATGPHPVNFLHPRMQVASLDHAMWFHRPFRAEEWLLYALDSPSASGARGFARGSIFDRGGRMVASVAQEGLIRMRASPSGGPGREASARRRGVNTA